jgi:WD40 repeat protein
MQYSQPVVSQAPPQIYLSAIMFAPKNSCVREQFRESALQVVLHLPMIQNDWSPMLYTFKFPVPVDVVAFMPGGAVAAITMQNSILVWNLSTGRCLKKLEGHRRKITSCIFSKNGKTLATSSCDHTVRLWEPISGQSIHCFEGHTAPVTTVIFSPDDTLLASASHDNTVRIWSSSDGQLIDVLKGHTDSVHNLLFSFDGKVLASSSSEGSIILWNCASGKALQKFQLDGFIINMAFTNGGTRLACIEDNGDQKLSLWNLANNSCEFQKRYGDDTCDMVFSLNGRWCAMYYDLDVLLYHLDDSSIFCRFLSGQENDVHAMAFSPNEKVLATMQEDGLLRIWNTATAECTQTLVGRKDVRSIFWSQESDSILSIHADNSLWLWDLSSEKHEGHEHFEFASCDMEYIDLSPRMNVALSTANCSPANLWDTKDGRLIAQLGKMQNAIPDYPYQFSPDGRLLASGILDHQAHKVILWNPLNGDYIKALEGHSARVTAVRISHDCKVLVSASTDDTLRIWDLNNFHCSQVIRNVSEGRILRKPPNPYVGNSSVQDVIISQDKSTVGSIENGRVLKYIRIWDLSTGHCRQTWNLRPSLVILSSDGEICAMSFIWNEVHVWSTNDGTCLHRLKMHCGTPEGLSFALDGKTLISQARNTIQLWNLETGQCQQTCDVKTARLLFRDGLNILQVAGSEIQICSDQSIVEGHSTYHMKGSWITKNNRKLILLPQDYAEPSAKLSNEDMVLLGYTSGKVICLNFRSVETLHGKRKRSS